MRPSVLPSVSRWRLSLLVALMVSALVSPAARAGEKTSFKIAWSRYVGWMPWDYADQSGILGKWADKYGIKIELKRVNNYLDSIDQYTAGSVDGCVMTNMDMLTIPSTRGVDSTALIVGDYSSGNDAVVLKGAAKKLIDIKGQSVHLVELSVSHYLLARALTSVGLSESDIKIVNTSDADMVRVFAKPGATAAVAWKPQLSELLAMPTSTLVFSSSKIPGEILDLMVVNTKVLKDNPRLGKALVGAWYETLAIMRARNAAATAALEAMAKASGTDLAGFKGQLATTYLFATPASALEVTNASYLVKKMDLVRTFSYEHGLLGAGAKSVDAVGIVFPGGITLGNEANIKMRFDADYVRMAADGTL